ncbi:MAG: tyrosine-type recombinase/integrase [Mycobacteriales bacterium]
MFPSVFGTPLDPRNALRACQAVAIRAGLGHVKLHTLRHTCASLLLAQGVHPRVVMGTLGHSGISITMDTYSHVLPSSSATVPTNSHRRCAGKSRSAGWGQRWGQTVPGR